MLLTTCGYLDYDREVMKINSSKEGLHGRGII